VAHSLLTDPQIGGQIDRPPKALSFSNGEPCYAQSTSGQLLGTASRRRRHRRDRGSTADRARVRSAVDSPILKQAVRICEHRNMSDGIAVDGRGRDEDFSSPPAQIPACAANAPGLVTFVARRAAIIRIDAVFRLSVRTAAA
jgi:hypothetical protein